MPTLWEAVVAGTLWAGWSQPPPSGQNQEDEEFDGDGRLRESDFRDRVVDVMEEHFKFTVLLRDHADFLVDRYSERKEIAAEGRLLTQAEKHGAEKIEQKKP